MAMTKGPNRKTPLQTACSIDELPENLSKIESAFSLKVSETISIVRLQEMKPSIEFEIQRLENLQKKYTHDEEELAQALDLLTWIEFKDDSPMKALELNDKSLTLTQGKTNSLFCLGNRANLFWLQGNLAQSRFVLNQLDQMKQDSQQYVLLTATVKTHQAYCYFRLGGARNLQQAITLYEEALRSVTDNHLWRLQAGKVYARMSHPNMMEKNSINQETNKKLEEKAHAYFHDVAKNAKNPRLRAFAFSDLAASAGFHRDPHNTVLGLCRQALSLHTNDPYILVLCGKSLKFKNTKMALDLLIEASQIHPNSHCSFLIGSCFQLKANREKKNPRAYEPLTTESEKYYREAIRLSSRNFAARYSLGRLLKSRGDTEKALTEFLTIVNKFRIDNHLLTLMKTYEQAAMCLLNLSKQPGYLSKLPSPGTQSDLEKDAETMLLKALNISFKLLSREEMERFMRESLESIKTIADKKDTPEKLSQLARMHLLAKDPENSLKTLDKLLEYLPGDVSVVTSALENYLRLECYEEALAILNKSLTYLDVNTIDDRLRRRVTLSAAWTRLLQSSGDAALLFKAMFDSYNLNRHKLVSDSTDIEQGLRSLAISSQVEDSASNQLDVLLLYDDSQDNARGVSSTGAVARQLQHSMRAIFGLNVSFNLQSCCAGVPMAELQLEEMTKSELVLVLVGSESLDSYFKSLLGFLPSVMEQRETTRAPPRVLVATTEDGLQVPRPLRFFQTLQPIGSSLTSFKEFEKFGLKNEANIYLGRRRNEDHVAIGRHVGNIMSLFCSLLSTSWPLPQSAEERGADAELP